MSVHFHLQSEHRVPGVDEEGVQVSAGDGRVEHPQRAETAGEAGRPAGQDTEGTRRIPREGEGLIPQVRLHFQG